MDKGSNIADIIVGYIKQEDDKKLKTAYFFRNLLLIAIVAVIGFGTYYLVNKKHYESNLEAKVIQLEAELKKQGVKITDTRKENDERVKETVQEAYEEVEALGEDEVDALWEEFMDGVRQRNYERKLRF